MILDPRASFEIGIDLVGVEILTAADDHVLDPADNLDVVILIHYTQVAAVAPSVIVKSFLSRLAGYHRVALCQGHQDVGITEADAMDVSGISTVLGIEVLATHGSVLEIGASRSLPCVNFAINRAD